MPLYDQDFERILTTLTVAGVRFVVIGGVAMALHGCAHLTDDVAICYKRDDDNLRALQRILGET